MKKCLLLVSIASLCMFTAQAQIKKGAIFLGGNLSGGYSKTKTADTSYTKNDALNVAITYGKAIRENLVFGAIISTNINTSKNYYSSGNHQKTTGYSAGIFLRKYKQLGNSGFYIFANSDLGVNFYKYKVDYMSNNTANQTKRTTISVSAYPGISYTISKRFQLETGFNDFASINYVNEKTTSLTPSGTVYSEFKTKGFNAGVSLDNLSSLYLGFRVLIN